MIDLFIFLELGW